MIDLNKDTYDLKPTADREHILEQLDDYQIFRHYIQEDFELSKAFNSPLRKDSVPSFNIFYASNNGKLMYKDLATEDRGDCFMFVQKLFGFVKYFDAIRKICTDFNLTNLQFTPIGNIPDKVVVPEKRAYEKRTNLVEISVKRRPWNKLDQQYWQAYGITKKTLELYNVAPVSHIFFNRNIYKCDRLAYCYRESKDGRVSYKIYQPMKGRSEGKFINNADWKVHQGYTQLPPTGPILVITKSLKDVMTIFECGYPAVAPQAETIPLNDAVVREYKRRFKRVILMYDYDNAGVKNTEKLSTQFDLDYTFIKDEDDRVKDISDMRKIKGRAFTEDYLNTILVQ